MGDVDDLTGAQPFGAAQHQVMVLRAFEAGPKAAHLAHQLRLQRGQVADQVLRQAQVVVPVGLEVRVLAQAFGAQLVLVGIDQAGLGEGLDGFCQQQQGVLCQHVVVVEQHHPVAAGERQRGVRGLADVAIASATHHTHP